MDKKEQTPVVILKSHFGQKHGQTLAEFAKEVKALEPKDKDELVKLAAEELGVAVKED